MQTVNMNPKTGIRYGIISANDVDSEFLNDFDPVYADVFCSSCGEKLTDTYCSNCETENMEYQEQEQVGHVYNRNGLHITADHDFIYLTVLKSPTVFKCRLCSPCYPNAGDLSTKGSLRTYGIPTKYLSENFERN